MRIKILSIILSVLIVSSCITVISSATEYTPGDVTGDGKVKITDARLILRASIGLEIFDESRAKAADLNGDGKIKTVDARIALRIALGLDDLNNYTTVPETTAAIETTPNTTEPTTKDGTTTEITTETVTVPITTDTTTTTNTTPTTDAPTETETDAPTEEESEMPTEAPKDGQLNFYQKYYVDCVAYDDETNSPTPLRFATDGKNYYARTNIDDKDTGFIIKKVIGGRDLYMINYNTNEYLVMGNAYIVAIKGIAGDGFDLDAMIADTMGEIQMAVPYITSYDSMRFDGFETIGGVEYAVCNTIYNGLPMKVYFRESETNAAITKTYTNEGKLLQTIVFNEINSNPDEYFKAPKGMKKITFSFSFSNMDAAMNFMKSFG